MGKTIKKIFTEEELEQIPEMFKNGMSMKSITKHFKVSEKRFIKILLNLGIDIQNPECEYRKKKPIGYWNNKEHCEAVAKQCRNRGDFSKRFVTAYQYSIANGWIKDFDQYFSNDKLFYGFNDKIHIIYAYEILSEHAVYVGRTINLKQRHNSHKNGTMHTNHKIYKDTVYDFCQSVGVDLPEPKILETGLTATESQRQENFWCNKYHTEGWFIINKAATGEGSSSLGATVRKWNYDACKEAAEHCTSKIDFKEKFSTAYRVSCQNGWIDEFFGNLLHEKGCFDTLENCIEESRKYESLSVIRKNYPFLYHKICKNKWNDAIRKANGWAKFGEIKKDRIKDTAVIQGKCSLLDCIDIEVSKMSSYELKIYYNISHYDVKLLADSVYGSRLNFLINNSLVIGVDTLKTNLEFSNRISHMTFLNELIKYNEMGYPMFHIFDSDLFINEEIVFDKINNGLNFIKDYNKIDGRKCQIREIYKQTSDEFLNKNHIQGECCASVYIGAYYDDELVAVMCFRNGGSSCRDGWELVRFAGKINTIIRGVGGKILKEFIKVYEPEKIISFCDRRYLKDVSDNFYIKNNFTVEKLCRPDYKYVDIKADIPKTYHKLFFNKKKLSKKYGFPIEMTETEMAKELGYDRIWDCGLVRYAWYNKKMEV